jgi:hypothetical protein
MSAYGTKRTTRHVAVMSATDPFRTSNSCHQEKDSTRQDRVLSEDLGSLTPLDKLGGVIGLLWEPVVTVSSELSAFQLFASSARL